MSSVMMETSDRSEGPLLLDGSDLLCNAVEHLAFLRELHRLGITLVRPTSKSLDRYLRLWLPLVARNDSEEFPLIPPPDIAWLWHCHRLAPLRYETYTKNSFGKILEASAPFQFQREDGDPDARASHTRTAWSLAYPHEPFFLEEQHEHDASAIEHVNVGGFDLVGSASRQKLFLWQVSQPRFEDLTFLQQGVLKYQNFLSLRPENKALPLVPTYQIDLLWHTHITTSISKYNEDCIKIRGQILNHDDSLDDRTPGAPLDVSFKETCRLWEKVYGEEYVVAGGMYRGIPPTEFFEPNWDAGASHTAEEISVILSGSNSTGTQATDPWRVPSKTNSSFIPAAPKSRIKDVNANPKRENNVFGKGSAGVGYYSLETKDAYDILYKRLKKREQQQQLEYTCFMCYYTCCVGCCRKRCEAEKKSKQEDMAKTVDVLAFLEARKQSSGPHVALLEDELKKIREKGLQRHHLEGNTYAYDGGYWATAGGCDLMMGDRFGAAACGGGNCGGGGCGGGACGGGGGGGCGGGGGGGGCGG